MPAAPTLMQACAAGLLPVRATGDGPQRAIRLRATYVASQGRELGRDGRVALDVDEQGQVWIDGRVQPVIEGRGTW